MDTTCNPIGARMTPDNITIFASAVEDTEVISGSTIVDQLDLTIDDIIELTKNQVRSMINQILRSISHPRFGEVIHLRLRPEINPLELDVYMTLSKILTFDSNEVYSYTVASFAIKTGFGNLAFTLDTSELDIAKNMPSDKEVRLEDTVTGRAIACYIYDALSNLTNGMIYNEATAEKVKYYLNRFK